MIKQLISTATLLGLLAGCSSFKRDPVPTPYPPDYLPTVIALTAGAAFESGTQTAAVVLPTEAPSRTPRPTLTITAGPTNTPTSIPGHRLAAVEIQAPGPMSKVVSPINLRMNIIAGASRRVQIDLFGEDGRLISRILKRNVPTSTDGLLQTAKINFEIPGLAETGRISVSTYDDQGRLQSLNSVHVLLLSSGTSEITPAGNPSEPVGVLVPLPNDVISGGVVEVSGDVWPFNTQPIFLEVVDLLGSSLGLRILAVGNIDPQKFETTVPYKTPESVAARLVIRQDDDRIPGLFYLYSQDITLNP